MDPVELAGEGWRSGSVLAARTPLARWRGLRPRPAGRAMLLAGCMVHGVGMDEPVWAVGIDGVGRVLATRLLAPGRLVRFRKAAVVLELPLERRPPRPGLTLTVRGPPNVAG